MLASHNVGKAVIDVIVEVYTQLHRSTIVIESLLHQWLKHCILPLEYADHFLLTCHRLLVDQTGYSVPITVNTWM